MKKSYYYFLVKFSIFLFAFTLSTHFSQGNNGWSVKYENPKVFIENQGQFHIYNSKEKVLYAYDDGSTMIYFTSKGITYSFLKRWKKDGKENERERENLKKGKSHAEMEAEENKMEFKTDVVRFTWENANPDVEMIPAEETSDYHSYTIKAKDGSEKNVNYVKGYKKIIYKNLYPNIDVEYVFHPDNGLKYVLILHPGADISKVKMKYDDVIKLKGNGDLHIPSVFGDIVDHAPITFYSDNKSKIISSDFVKTDKTVSFELGTYDHSKTLIIDPWVQTPTITNSNSVWECERDGSGNVYIIGGDMPMKLMKYNAAGVYQWTYNTTWDTVNYWLGTFAVDLAGNSYVTSGTSSKISKVNTGGSNVWTNNSIGGSSQELWNITFNCDQTRLIIGGTSGFLALRGSIFDLDVTNGSVVTNKIVGYNKALLMGALGPDEVRSICSAQNGRYYFLILDSVGRISQNFTACSSNASLYKISSTYDFAYYNPSYRYDNAGIMAIRANKNFLYTQNGNTLHKRSLSSLAILSTVTIPGGINVAGAYGNPGQVPGSSGLDIDSCGNVYVGSSTGIYKYDANLTQIGFVSLPFTVFDVAVSTGGNVIVAGSTTNSGVRTGYVQSIASFTACSPLTLFCCNATVCPVASMCSTAAAITLSGATPGGSWSGAGVNPSTGVFNPATAGAGVHNIVYTLPCGADSISITVNACATLTACQENNGNITVTGGTAPYTWQRDSTFTDCSACPLGQCIPGFCNGVPGTISTTFATGSSVSSPGIYPIHVTDASSNSLIITSLSSLPNCSGIICSTLTVTPSNIIHDSCFGQSIGSFNASTAGGDAPWDYVLKNSGGTTVATFTNVTGTQSFTGLAAGTYTLHVNDTNNCPGTIIIAITQPPAATTTATAGPDQSICGNSTVLAGNAPTVGTGIWTIVSGTGTITTPSSATSGVTGLGIGTTVFKWTITNPPCSSTYDQVSITYSGGGPMITIASQTNVSCYGGNNASATASASGGIGSLTYSWTGGGGGAATAHNLAAGTYTITVTDGSGCTGIATVAIIQPDSISAHVNTTPTACGSSSGSATIVAHGGTGNLSYLWSYGFATTSSISNLGGGTYTVNVTDSAGCSKIVSGTIATSGGPTANAGTDVTISSGSSTQLNATGGGTYSWTPATGLSCDTCRTPTAKPFVTTIYYLTVTDSMGCKSVDSVVVTVKEYYFIPNVFSPNNDGINDLFELKAEGFKNYHAEIFNRWGEKVFETTDTNVYWNGHTKSGSEASGGVYFYSFSLTDYKDQQKIFKGFLSLIR